MNFMLAAVTMDGGLSCGRSLVHRIPLLGSRLVYGFIRAKCEEWLRQSDPLMGEVNARVFEQRTTRGALGPCIHIRSQTRRVGLPLLWLPVRVYSFAVLFELCLQRLLITRKLLDTADIV